MVTETTTQSWFSRIGDSFKGLLIGTALIVASVCFLFWNEGRTIKRTKALNEGAKAVVDVDSNVVDSANEGKLVHLTGDAVSSDVLVDPFFNVSTQSIKLVRRVEMFQWQEDVETHTERTSGGGTTTTKTYSYEKVWSENPIDSSNFKESGHDNPNSFPVSSEEFSAENVTLGSFKLSPSLIAAIRSEKEFIPDKEDQVKEDDRQETDQSAAITKFGNSGDSAEANDDDQAPGDLYTPAATEDEYQAEFVDDVNETSQGESVGFVPVANGFYKGNPNQVNVGDVRVTYTYVPSPLPISVVSQQQGESFVPYKAKTGNVELLEIGTVSAEDMFVKAQNENKALAWIIRLFGLIVIFFGFKTLFNPLVVLADVVPFAAKIVGMGVGFVAFCLSLCLTLTTIAVGWLAYRPLIAVPLLAVAAFALIYPFFKGKSKKETI